MLLNATCPLGGPLQWQTDEGISDGFLASYCKIFRVLVRRFQYLTILPQELTAGYARILVERFTVQSSHRSGDEELQLARKQLARESRIVIDLPNRK